jgi:hypothetical protein
MSCTFCQETLQLEPQGEIRPGYRLAQTKNVVM